MIVLDASVFAKLFLQEEDRGQALDLIDHAVEGERELVAPTLLLYEALSIALRHDVPFEPVIGLLEKIRGGGLRMREPTPSELLKAWEIATHGTRQAGYPDLADSIYHAMAIEGGGVFVTADHRHLAKAKKFGHVVRLADWRPD